MTPNREHIVEAPIDTGANFTLVFGTDLFDGHGHRDAAGFGVVDPVEFDVRREPARVLAEGVGLDTQLRADVVLAFEGHVVGVVRNVVRFVTAPRTETCGST